MLVPGPCYAQRPRQCHLCYHSGCPPARQQHTGYATMQHKRQTEQKLDRHETLTPNINHERPCKPHGLTALAPSSSALTGRAPRARKQRPSNTMVMQTQLGSWAFIRSSAWLQPFAPGQRCHRCFCCTLPAQQLLLLVASRRDQKSPAAADSLCLRLCTKS